MRVTLWREPLPAWLNREHVVLAPGERCSCDAWVGALVIVEHGRVVLTGAHGTAVTLREAAVLTGFDGARVRNAGPGPAALTVGRRS